MTTRPPAMRTFPMSAASTATKNIGIRPSTFHRESDAKVTRSRSVNTGHAGRVSRFSQFLPRQRRQPSVALLALLGISTILGACATAATPEPTARPTLTPIPLDSLVLLEMTGCEGGDAHGLVGHAAAYPLDIFIQVTWRIDGVRVDNALVSVPDLEPGEPAQWSTTYLGPNGALTCRAEIDSVFESR